MMTTLLNTCYSKQLEWINSNIVYDDSGLYINEMPVVQYWERPVQECMANKCTKTHGNVLEVGFGLGMASDAIQANNPKNYTIIEAHPVLAKKARNSRHKAVKVINDFWQNCIYKLAEKTFDGIVFDAFLFDDYAIGDMIDLKLTQRLIEPFLTHAHQLLKRNGVISFIDMSNDIYSSQAFQSKIGPLFSDVEIDKLFVEIPVACDYAQGNEISVVSLRK